MGGGLGGLTCARRLAEHAGELEVQLVDRNPEHRFPPSFPWVIVGRRRGEPGEVSRPLENLTRLGVRFTHAQATGIDLDRCSVSTLSGAIPYDQLVLAPGASLAPESVDGLAQAHGFYTLPEALRLRRALAAFRGGRVLIVVAATPYRSLAAPYEAAFLIDELLRKSGVAAKVDIATAEPRPIPVADRSVGDQVAAILARRGIGFQSGRSLEAVDPVAREARFADGSEPFDLLVAVPPHRAPPFVAESPLAGPDGWIRAESLSLSAHPNVYAIGDVTEIELARGGKLPKAGVLAQAQAIAVASNIAAAAAGRPPSAPVRCVAQLPDGRRVRARRPREGRLLPSLKRSDEPAAASSKVVPPQGAVRAAVTRSARLR